MSESKAREFWIMMSEQDDILLTKPHRIRNQEKYIHVIEHTAVEELQRKLGIAVEFIKEINCFYSTKRDAKNYIEKLDEIGTSAGETLKQLNEVGK